jgi:hypothetical protein
MLSHCSVVMLLATDANAMLVLRLYIHSYTSILER